MPVAINISKFKVRSLSVDSNTISWEIGETNEDVLDYTFQLLRSESAEGPFESVSSTFEDRYSFVDNAVPHSHNYRQLHYLLRVTLKSDSSTKDFGPASREPEANLIVTELRTHVNLLMREFAGRRCWVLPVRTFGQRCTACYNVTLQKKRKSGCISCYDTSWTRGYLRPIESWMQIDPNPDAEQQSAVGPTQQQTTTARLGASPSLKVGDLVIEAENHRWRVTQVNQTQHNRSPIHQEVSIHLIPSMDMEYKIKFDLDTDFQKLNLSPSRNFTNPQTLESAQDEDIPDILGIYPPPSRS